MLLDLLKMNIFQLPVHSIPPFSFSPAFAFELHRIVRRFIEISPFTAAVKSTVLSQLCLKRREQRNGDPERKKIKHSGTASRKKRVCCLWITQGRVSYGQQTLVNLSLCSSVLWHWPTNAVCVCVCEGSEPDWDSGGWLGKSWVTMATQKQEWEQRRVGAEEEGRMVWDGRRNKQEERGEQMSRYRQGMRAAWRVMKG